jgi:hypothetical protein
METMGGLRSVVSGGFSSACQDQQIAAALDLQAEESTHVTDDLRDLAQTGDALAVDLQDAVALAQTRRPGWASRLDGSDR